MTGIGAENGANVTGPEMVTEGEAFIGAAAWAGPLAGAMTVAARCEALVLQTMVPEIMNAANRIQKPRNFVSLMPSCSPESSRQTSPREEGYFALSMTPKTGPN